MANTPPGAEPVEDLAVERRWRSGTRWWIAKLDTTTSKSPRSGSGRVEVVPHHLDPGVAGEPGAGPVEHLVLEVDADAGRAGPGVEHELERVPVAGAEVEHAVDRRRQDLEQHLVRLATPRDRVAPLEVVDGVLRVRPQVHVGHD